MKGFIVRFKVAGYGPLPLDMLRYDTCFPSRPESVNAMIDGMENHKAMNIVELMHYAFNKPSLPRNVKGEYVGDICTPCVGRWKSFGWKVIDVELQKVEL